jgi:hypothetical protein
MDLFNKLIRKLGRSNQQITLNNVIQNSIPSDSSLSANLDTNEAALRQMFSDCADVAFRRFMIGGKTNALLIYTEGTSNVELIDRHLLLPLMQTEQPQNFDLYALLEQKISVSNYKPTEILSDIAKYVLLGNPVLLIDGQQQGTAFNLTKLEKRSIEEPTAESVIRGARDGFTETLAVNMSLLRRRIPSPQFKMKQLTIGRYTQTSVVISYIEGIADKTLIQEVTNRLQNINIDGILESGTIEELIEDTPFSPFPQVLNTERPDVAVSGILEGRVAIVIDNTPTALVVPVSFYSLTQAADDYYQRYLIGTMIRWLRYLFLVIALLLPSLYVALLTYHQEMIPTRLLLSIAESREKIPFPALIEALLMEVTFEALREAGLRLPKQVGSAVSIVGALVIGEAAVSAGLVSAPMVIVVSLTGIASFTIPRYNASIALRMLRFPMIFLAGTLGLLGIMLGVIAIIIHMATLRSFGIPYLSPMAPMKFREMKDVLIRAPWWQLNTRPRLTGKFDKYRQAPRQKPGPRPEDE